MGETPAQQYQEVMKNNPKNEKLQAISKEIDELTDNKIDFNQIMDENFKIGEEDAKKIVAYIDELLSGDFSNRQDLKDLKTYLQPFANPISTESMSIEKTGYNMVNLNDSTISNLIKNKEYGINSKLDTLLKNIKKDNSLSQVKDNLQSIKDTLSNKKGILKSELLSIHDFLKKVYPDPKDITINGGKVKIDIQNTQDENILIYLYAYLDNLSSQVKDLSDRNSTVDSIKDEISSTTVAVDKFVNRSDFGNNPELSTGYPEINEDEKTRIIDYIKESGSDSILSDTKEPILETYWRHLANKDNIQGIDPNVGEIKSAIENNYDEIDIIKNFINNFIKNNNEFTDENLNLYVRSSPNSAINNINDLKKLFSMYVENDGSHNPKVISYYRKNLADGNLSTSIKENYPEIQATEQSINKLVITKLNDFSKLKEKDIKNITDYITSTKNIGIISDMPKGQILNYYNANIKGKAPEGTKTDKENFDSIKSAIEDDKGYREEIVKGELDNLYKALGEGKIITYDFNSDIIQSYRKDQEHFCIFEHKDFDAYKVKINEEIGKQEQKKAEEDEKARQQAEQEKAEAEANKKGNFEKINNEVDKQLNIGEINMYVMKKIGNNKDIIRYGQDGYECNMNNIKEFLGTIAEGKIFDKDFVKIGSDSRQARLSSVQIFLNKERNTGLKVDGKWVNNGETYKAVKTFQEEYNKKKNYKNGNPNYLKPDGIPGPKTLAQLLENPNI